MTTMSATRTHPSTEEALAARPYLYSGFLESAERFPDRPALEVAGETLTYAALREQAFAIASALERSRPADGSSITAVYAYRTPAAFAGILGALLSGHGYVALNRRFPPERTRLMLEKADARAIVVDRESAEQLDEVLDGFDHRLLLVCPEHDDVAPLRERWPNHTVLGRSDLHFDPSAQAARPDPAAVAYLIFTSGSTGTPKAVMVPHTHIRRYLELMAERWEITEHDRLSETFDMTFDLSVSDIFLGWERGACICCPTAEEVVKPAKFIREAGITVWYAVPSVGLLMKRFGMLKPGSYPDVRLVLFCGEPLPIELAAAWAEAAPKAIVENVYGPTEVTITCAVHRFDAERTPSEAEFGVVPIGDMYPGMQAVILDEQAREVAPGQEGELYLVGPQVTPGYWRDPERTAAAFFVPPGRTGVHYKTGDRVRRPLPGRPMTYLAESTTR